MTKTLASGFGWQMHIAAKQRVAAKTVCGPGIPILAMFKNVAESLVSFFGDAPITHLQQDLAYPSQEL